MKKSALKYVFGACLTFIIGFCSFFIIHNFIFNSKNQKELLDIAENIVKNDVNDVNINLERSNNIQEKNVLVEGLKEDRNVIGKIKIEKIGVEAPIVDGVSQNDLKYAVGHFPETAYWTGNVCLASHNRGNYAHYFEKLNKLSIGDEIEYQTKLGTKMYRVDKIDEISEENLSVLNNTKENTITLITCIKSKPELRLCVKGIAK